MGSAGDPLSAAASLRQQLDAAVIVTVGEEGAWLVDDGEPELLAAHEVDAVDTVGAGDAFCGALGARLAAGAALPRGRRSTPTPPPPCRSPSPAPSPACRPPRDRGPAG